MAETVLFTEPPFLCEAGLPGGSVTLVKSNAKALLTLRIKSALALSEGERGYDVDWARSRWRTALTAGTGACHAPVSGGERTGSPTEVGRHPDAFEVRLPRLFTFGFCCGGFVLREAFMAEHRVELSGKFPVNGLLQREHI